MIKTIRFNIEDHPAEVRLDALAAFWGKKATILATSVAAEAILWKGRLDILGDIGLIQYRGSAYNCERPGARKGQYATGLSVAVITSGHGQVVVGNKSYGFKTGDILIYNPELPFHLNAFSTHSMVVATIPARDTDFSVQDPVVLEKIATETPQAKVLHYHIKTLCESLFAREYSSAVLLAKGLGNLIEGLLRPGDLQTQQMDRFFFKRGAIVAFIEQNILSRDLNPSSLAKRFAVSRATLYRIFRDYGGIANHIAVRRLDASYAALVQSRGVAGAVGTISQALGYYDPAHFTHRFKQHFGATPKQIGRLGQAYDRKAGTWDADNVLTTYKRLDSIAA